MPEEDKKKSSDPSELKFQAFESYQAWVRCGICETPSMGPWIQTLVLVVEQQVSSAVFQLCSSLTPKNDNH